MGQCYPENIYLFKVNSKNTKKGGEICSKLTIRRSIFFIVNFEHIFLVFSLLTLSKQMPTEYVAHIWIRNASVSTY